MSWPARRPKDVQNERIEGVFICIYGLVFLRPYEVAGGVIVSMLLKAWLLDRMVWLYDEMRMANTTHSAWLYG